MKSVSYYVSAHINYLYPVLCCLQVHQTYLSTITYGCLSTLLSWAKSKQSLMKYNRSHVDTTSGDMQQGDTASSTGTSTNLSQLVHAVIRNIDTYGAGSSCSASQRQLRRNLPHFCHLNRTVCRILTPGTAYCCLTAECLYVSHSDSTSSCKTDAEHK